MFYREQAIGVVIEHYPHQGGSAVRLATFDHLLTLAANGDAASQAVAEALGLPQGPTLLPVVNPVELGPAVSFTGGWRRLEDDYLDPGELLDRLGLGKKLKRFLATPHADREDRHITPG